MNNALYSSSRRRVHTWVVGGGVIASSIKFSPQFMES